MRQSMTVWVVSEATWRALRVRLCRETFPALGDSFHAQGQIGAYSILAGEVALSAILAVSVTTAAEAYGRAGTQARRRHRDGI